MTSNAPERQRRILEWLTETESLRTEELRQRLGVTAMTLWRDLVALEEHGRLKRLRGRVTRADHSVVEPDFRSKTVKAHAAKQRIAAAAARLVKEGDSLAMDGGTTVAFMAEEPLPRNVSVFTNSLHTAARFLEHPARPAVYACGGLLRGQSGTFIGREALTFFSRRNLKHYFLSATGVDASAGITDLTLEDNEVKQAMAAASSEVILLADKSKFGQVSLMQVLPWRRLNRLITDAPEAQFLPIQQANPRLQVHCV